ncbi:sialate O-acetylesterase [bacterium]|nr:sialate O-acetylesterase [bacterium]
MRSYRLAVAALAVVAVSAAHADVRLPHIFGSHMVLQRDIAIPVWGWADQGEAVRVQLGDKAAVTATPGEGGKWVAKLPAQPAGGPFTLTVSGKNQVVLEDVLIGEVWLCSGQSNMQWTVSASNNATEEIANANHPQLRHIAVPRVPSGYPAADFDGAWQVCTPEVAGSFTAAGYFFGRYLLQELKVPIGLVNSSWGGTSIDPWTPPEGFARVPSLEPIYKQVMLTDPRSDAYKQTLGDYLTRLDAWTKTAREALAAQKPLEPAPEYPAGLKPLVGPGGASTLYHGMIYPLLPFAIRGAIWYQGEANHREGMRYRDKMEALIGGWRQLFGVGDFPFYYVQIAPYVYGNEDPFILPTFWEAQTAAQGIPNTGQVVIHDIGDLTNIHPKNKQDVGKRLALWALAKTYGRKDLVYTGPTFKTLAIEGGKLRVTFDNVGSGLTTRDGKAPDMFEIIGKDTEFVKADTLIESNAVVLSAAGVKEPVAMRFAWHRDASPNLMNKEGLPAGAFRAGDVPVRDLLALNVGEAKEYQLVYALDLGKAGKEIKYDLDNRPQIGGPFDRIAYFLELQSAEGPVQWVYCSMDAFTDDLGKIGVPTLASKANFQKKVTNLNVVSNVEGIAPGSGLKGGCIEFWPHNYGPVNAAGIPGASNEVWDFGDQCTTPEDGYGSMQVGNFEAKQTIFAFNHWVAGGSADLGIGNSTGKNPDWTFAGNAGSYSLKNLRVLVRVRK